jgi:hypothetical protein
MGAVAISMDAVKKKADVRITTNQKKRWISKPWRGGMRIAEAMRNGKVNWRMEYDTEKRIDTSTR